MPAQYQIGTEFTQIKLIDNQPVVEYKKNQFMILKDYFQNYKTNNQYQKSLRNYLKGTVQEKVVILEF